MKRSRFTEEQIIGILKEQEAGLPTSEVCRKHSISSATFYKYKAKYGGLEVSDARKLKALADENAKLKKLRRLYREEKLQVRRRGGVQAGFGHKTAYGAAQCGQRTLGPRLRQRCIHGWPPVPGSGRGR